MRSRVLSGVEWSFGVIKTRGFNAGDLREERVFCNDSACPCSLKYVLIE